MDTKRKKIDSIVAIVLNAAVFLTVLLTTISYFFRRGDGNMAVVGAECFVFFTMDSNILAALGCLAAIPFHVQILRGQREELPTAVRVFKLSSAAAVAVTFFTVVFFLGPTMGYGTMYRGTNLQLHLICPLVCMLTPPLLENGGKLKLRYALFGVIPTVVYAVVYAILVIGIGPENGGWSDFYGFNIGGMWYLSMAIMTAATWLLSAGLYFLCEIVRKRRERSAKIGAKS